MAKVKKSTSKKSIETVSPEDLRSLISASTGIARLDITHWLSTGSFTADLAISGGRGLPGGKLTEIAGDSASGKTALALSICRQAQLLGGDVVYLDAEARLSDTLAEFLIEVDINNNFIYTIPANLEEALDLIEQVGVAAAKVETPTVIVLDSISALSTLQQSLEGGQLGNHKRVMGSAANLISWFFARGILRKINGSNVFIIMISQLREKLDFSPVPGANKKITTGGHAVGYYSQTRLIISQEPLEKLGKDVGAMIKVHVKKTTMGPPHKVARIPFYFDEFEGARGMDEHLAWINYLIGAKVIKKVGSMYEIAEVRQYKKRWVQQMRDNPEFAASIKNLVRATFKRKPDAGTAREGVDE